MILVSCVENRDGLRFNGRRCSRDREVCRDLLERSRGKLWLARESLGTAEKLLQPYGCTTLRMTVMPEAR